MAEVKQWHRELANRCYLLSISNTIGQTRIDEIAGLIADITADHEPAPTETDKEIVEKCGNYEQIGGHACVVPSRATDTTAPMTSDHRETMQASSALVEAARQLDSQLAIEPILSTVDGLVTDRYGGAGGGMGDAKT